MKYYIMKNKKKEFLQVNPSSSNVSPAIKRLLKPKVMEIQEGMDLLKEDFGLDDSELLSFLSVKKKNIRAKLNQFLKK